MVMRSSSRNGSAAEARSRVRSSPCSLSDAAATGQLLPATHDWIERAQALLKDEAGLAAIELAENISADQRAEILSGHSEALQKCLPPPETGAIQHALDARHEGAIPYPWYDISRHGQPPAQYQAQRISMTIRGLYSLLVRLSAPGRAYRVHSCR